MNRLSPRFLPWPLLLILALQGASLSWASAPAVALTDDFSSVSGQWLGGEAANGVMTLAVQGSDKRFNGSRLLLVPPVRIPEDESQALRVSFTIVGFSEATGVGDYKAAARIFLMPEPLPKFTEPYSASDTFALIVTHSPLNGSRLSLYRKQEGDRGFGKPLYEGSLETGQFPVRVDMLLTRTLYRLRFDRDVLSDRGSLSGHHELSPSVWGGDIRFGMRIVNETDGIRGQVILDDFEASVARGLR